MNDEQIIRAYMANEGNLKETVRDVTRHTSSKHPRDGYVDTLEALERNPQKIAKYPLPPNLPHATRLTSKEATLYRQSLHNH